MTTPRLWFPAVSLQNGQALLVSNGTAELFDSATLTFSSAGALTIDRGTGLSATLLQDGTVLIVGGLSTASAELYDPVSGAFSATGSMSVPRVLSHGDDLARRPRPYHGRKPRR